MRPRHTCLRCGREIHPAEWGDLPELGIQELAADDLGPGQRLQWRRCWCGNALAIDLLDPARADYARHERTPLHGVILWAVEVSTPYGSLTYALSEAPGGDGYLILSRSDLAPEWAHLAHYERATEAVISLSGWVGK